MVAQLRSEARTLEEHAPTRKKFTFTPDYLSEKAKGHCITLFKEFQRVDGEIKEQNEKTEKLMSTSGNSEETKQALKRIDELWERSGEINKLLDIRLTVLHQQGQLLRDNISKSDQLDVGAILQLKKVKFELPPLTAESFNVVIHGEE
jgi:hypothetical protein